jgi:hypothetical protein
VDLDLRLAQENTQPKIQSNLQYRSHEDPDAPKGTTSTGSRGCAQTDSNYLTLLVPSTHRGWTASAHPTFFWHLSETPSMPIQFTLVEYGVAKPIIGEEIRTAKAGINQLKMPAEIPGLVVGRKYRWSVSLICKPGRPSANPLAGTRIERISPTPEVEQQLAAVKSESDRARIYAQASFWYDALASIWTATNNNPTDPALHEDLLSLLNQVGLTQVAQQEQQRLNSKFKIPN